MIVPLLSLLLPIGNVCLIWQELPAEVAKTNGVGMACAGLLLAACLVRFPARQVGDAAQ
jgi:hypothetical protein